MKMTFSVPDELDRRFRASVPLGKRSSMIARLLEAALTNQKPSLSAACRAANLDATLNREIDEWQSIDNRKKANVLELEKKQRAGYARKPVAKGEFS